MSNSLGDFLRERRQEKNLTQKELSKLLFVSESAVSKWEKDVSRPDITLLPNLAEILGVSEHELITASIDEKTRTEKIQAKRWRTLSLSWSLFFYIAYGIALVPCFICNLAIDKTLSWFWIVLSALTLAFTFTNLPKLIKKYKLILIPLSQYLALILLLGVCCIFVKGNWFLIPALAVLLGMCIVFVPIYIAKYDVFLKFRKFADFISVAVDFIMLNILLMVINAYALVNGYVKTGWFFSVALPIVLGIYLVLNLFLSVRFLKTNKFIKTSIILYLIDIFMYIPPIFIKIKNPLIQKEIDKFNVFNANLLSWETGGLIENNIQLIICLSVLLLAVIFFTIGIIRHRKKN